MLIKLLYKKICVKIDICIWVYVYFSIFVYLLWNKAVYIYCLTWEIWGKKWTGAIPQQDFKVIILFFIIFVLCKVYSFNSFVTFLLGTGLRHRLSPQEAAQWLRRQVY